MDHEYPYQLRLPLAPYQFEWAGQAAVDCQTRRTPAFTEERYTHADGSVVIIRNYEADGSFHLLSDRGDFELVDRATDYRHANPVSVVRLP